MDQKSSTKQTTKKQPASADNKNKKSNKKKKKSISKSQKSSKKDSDPSPDVDRCLEIEGVRALDQTPGLESDSSGPPGQEVTSPVLGNTTSRTANNTYGTNDGDRLQPQSDFVSDSVSHVSVNSSVSKVSANESATNLNYKGLKHVPSVSSIDETLSTMSDVSLKAKSNTSASSKVRTSKGGNPRSASQSGAKGKKNDSNGKTSKSIDEVINKKLAESLRWENTLVDEEDENERLLAYKMNRRKRYLAAAQAKGLGWVVNYASNGSPVSEDSGIEVRDRELPREIVHRDMHTAIVNDFSSVKKLGPSPSNRSLISNNEYTY